VAVNRKLKTATKDAKKISKNDSACLAQNRAREYQQAVDIGIIIYADHEPFE
jgi:hypothetical protein